MEQLVLEKVNGSDFVYGRERFDVLYRVGYVGDPDCFFHYFDDVVNAVLFKQKLEKKAG